LFHPAGGRVHPQPVSRRTNPIPHGWLKGRPTMIVAALPAPAAPADPAATRTAWEAWQEGLAERFTSPAEPPPLRLLLVWDNLTGHKSAEMVVWLCRHGIMPLYAPLAGSWLNMAETIRRILKRRTLDGQHPRSPAEIGTWFRQTAHAWNRCPTPFLWDGKRRRRRRKRPGDGHAIGAPGAHSQQPIPAVGRYSHEWHSPRQVTR
jgi:transposase